MGGSKEGLLRVCLCGAIDSALEEFYFSPGEQESDEP